jgi:hypothetical protein
VWVIINEITDGNRGVPGESFGSPAQRSAGSAQQSPLLRNPDKLVFIGRQLSRTEAVASSSLRQQEGETHGQRE